MELKENYTITEISRSLQINRSSLYYKSKPSKDESVLRDAIKDAFEDSYQTYGTRRIRVEIKKLGLNVSRRKISAIMSDSKLVSVYTKPKYKPIPCEVNEDKISNIVARKFDGHSPWSVVVTDLTYVLIGGKWHYLCPLLDLCGRRLLGYSVGKNKTAELIQKAFHSVKGDLRKMGILHTDRGSEFRNKLIDELLLGFSIERSLSGKGNPFDNAVIEAFNKTVKTECINRYPFKNIQDFTEKMDAYMKWYNSVRLHSSLDYITPDEWVQNVS